MTLSPVDVTEVQLGDTEGLYEDIKGGGGGNQKKNQDCDLKAYETGRGRNEKLCLDS